MKKGFLMFILSITTVVYAQLPEWVNETPEGYKYDYFTGKGYSRTTKSEAIEIALQDAIVSIMRTGKITVSYSETDSIVSSQTIKKQDSDIDILYKTARELKIDGYSKTIKGLKHIETYTELNNKLFEAWVLVSIPKIKPLETPSKLNPVLRSVLIPGWGQFYNEQYFKGVSFMTLTAGTIIGGFILNELGKNATADANRSKTQSRRDFYNHNAGSYSTFSTICFISGIAMYIWNIADAVSYKKTKIYAGVKGMGINMTVVLGK